MKKIVLPIILAMCLLLSACGGNNADASLSAVAQHFVRLA